MLNNQSKIEQLLRRCDAQRMLAGIAPVLQHTVTVRAPVARYIWAGTRMPAGAVDIRDLPGAHLYDMQEIQLHEGDMLVEQLAPGRYRITRATGRDLRQYEQDHL